MNGFDDAEKIMQEMAQTCSASGATISGYQCSPVNKDLITACSKAMEHNAGVCAAKAGGARGKGESLCI